MSDTAALFDNLHLPYQIERWSIEDGPNGGIQVAIAYLDERDVAPGFVEFKTMVFDPRKPELDSMVVDLMRRMCLLIDAVKESKRAAPATRPPVRRE